MNLESGPEQWLTADCGLRLGCQWVGLENDLGAQAHWDLVCTGCPARTGLRSGRSRPWPGAEILLPEHHPCVMPLSTNFCFFFAISLFAVLWLISISSVPTATLPSRAHQCHHAPQLTAIMVRTCGEDKTCQCHLHMPHRAPHHLTAVPTTNGDDGDDTWQGQTCWHYMHMLHHAPCICTCYDFCPLNHIFHLFSIFLFFSSLFGFSFSPLDGNRLFKATKVKDHPSKINGWYSFHIS